MRRVRREYPFLELGSTRILTDLNEITCAIKSKKWASERSSGRDGPKKNEKDPAHRKYSGKRELHNTFKKCEA